MVLLMAEALGANMRDAVCLSLCRESVGAGLPFEEFLLYQF